MTKRNGKNLWQLVGCYYVCLLPRQDGGTSQIQVNCSFFPVQMCHPVCFAGREIQFHLILICILIFLDIWYHSLDAYGGQEGDRRQLGSGCWAHQVHRYVTGMFDADNIRCIQCPGSRVERTYEEICVRTWLAGQGRLIQCSASCF